MTKKKAARPRCLITGGVSACQWQGRSGDRPRLAAQAVYAGPQDVTLSPRRCFTMAHLPSRFVVSPPHTFTASVPVLLVSTPSCTLTAPTARAPQLQMQASSCSWLLLTHTARRPLGLTPPLLVLVLRLLAVAPPPVGGSFPVVLPQRHCQHHPRRLVALQLPVRCRPVCQAAAAAYTVSMGRQCRAFRSTRLRLGACGSNAGESTTKRALLAS